MQQLTTIAKVLALAQCLRVSERTSGIQSVIRKFSHSSLMKFGLLTTMIWLLPQLAWSQVPPFCVGDAVNPVAICQDITIDLDGTCNAEMGITYATAAVDQEQLDNDRFATTSTTLGQNFVAGVSGKLHSLVVIADVAVNTTLNIAGGSMAVSLIAGSNTIVLTGLDIDLIAGNSYSFDFVGDGGAIVPLALSDQNGPHNSPDTYVAGTGYNQGGNIAAIDLYFQILVQLAIPEIDNGTTDNCALASLTASQTAFTAAGTPTITLTATDKIGNVHTCTSVVTVQDIEDPTISCPAAPAAVNNTPTLCSAVVNGIAPTAFADNCSPVVVTYALTGATTGTGGADASGTAFSEVQLQLLILQLILPIIQLHVILM